MLASYRPYGIVMDRMASAGLSHGQAGLSEAFAPRQASEIDAVTGVLQVRLTGAQLGARRGSWKARETDHASGALWKYAQTAGSARDGAVARPGGKAEKFCYADL